MFTIIVFLLSKLDCNWRLRNSSYSSFNCSKSTKTFKTRSRYVSLATVLLILRSTSQIHLKSATQIGICSHLNHLRTVCAVNAQTWLKKVVPAFKYRPLPSVFSSFCYFFTIQFRFLGVSQLSNLFFDVSMIACPKMIANLQKRWNDKNFITSPFL